MTYKYKTDKNIEFKTEIFNLEIDHKYFSLDKSGKLIAKVNYAWDGMSFFPDSKETYRASLIHDVLYQMMRLELLPRSYKVIADRLLYRIAVEDGLNKFTALLVFLGVNVFGQLFTK